MTKASKGEIVKTENTPATIDTFIERAIEKEVPVETLEKLFDLRVKVEAQMAKKAFDEAMANFQAECPTITKTKSVSFGSGHAYNYAPIDSIVGQVKKLMGKHGFSYAIKVTVNGNVKAECIAKHIMGHSESSHMEVPISDGKMSSTQKVASSATFAKRYAFCNVFGIMTGDEDNEKSLQDKDFRSKTITEAKGRIKKAKSVEELGTVWGALPATAKVEKEIEAYKDKMKKKLETESEPMTDEEKVDVIETEASSEEQQAFIKKEGVKSAPF